MIDVVLLTSVALHKFDGGNAGIRDRYVRKLVRLPAVPSAGDSVDGTAVVRCIYTTGGFDVIVVLAGKVCRRVEDCAEHHVDLLNDGWLECYENGRLAP